MAEPIGAAATTMKAALCRRYGPPGAVAIGDVPRPAPRPHEVLVRIHAATVTSGDSRLRSLDVPRGFRLLTRLAFGLFRPRRPILGSECAGTVAAVGAGVTRFRVGDAVFAFTDVGLGCHAEYRAIPENGPILPKPAALSFAEAAALSFAGTTALYFLRERAGVRPGDRVLVIGASGAVGTALVQLARHFGATVTGVCSTHNLELVRSLGADRVIDYGRDDYAAGPARYDIVVDTSGTAGYRRCRPILAPGGRLVLVAASLPQMLAGILPGTTRAGHRIVTGVAVGSPERLRLLADLSEAGAYRPVVGTIFPFERIAEAHALVDGRHKRGSAVVSMLP